jgi:hypothetical protein
MTIPTAAVTADRILAIDLGKYKSVACHELAALTGGRSDVNDSGANPRMVA